MSWDVFISHAAEDKEAVARPLALALRDAGYRVWYDEFSLALGDGLVRSIDRGLAESRYGIVVISPNFLAKDWPRRELDGLVTREIAQGKVVLPVWHEVTPEQVMRVSPPLADKLGVSTARGLAHVVAQVRQVLDGPAAAAAPAMPSAAPPDTPRPAVNRRVLLAAGGGAAGLAAAGGAWWWQARRAAAEAALAGRWRIDANGNMLRSTLDLRVVDGRLQGTALIHYPDHSDYLFSGLYAQRQVPIEEGEFDGSHIAFVTRRRFRKSLSGSGADSLQLLRYRGRFEGERLLLSIQVEGGPLVTAEAHRPPAPPAGAALLATLPSAQAPAELLVALTDGTVGAVYAGGIVRAWRVDEQGGRPSFVQWKNRQPVRALLPLDATHVLVVEEHGVIEERDPRSGDRNGYFGGVPHLVEAVLPLPEGRLALAVERGTIALWNRATKTIERRLQDGDAPITHLARLPDGRLVSGDSNTSLQIRSVETGRIERTLRAADHSVGSGVDGLVVLEDGRIVAGLPREPRPQVFDPRSGTSTALDPGGPTTWARVLGLQDGQVLLVDSRDCISRWPPAGGAARRLVDFSDDEVGVDCALALSPNRLLLGRRDGTLQLWATA